MRQVLRLGFTRLCGLAAIALGTSVQAGTTQFLRTQYTGGASNNVAFNVAGTALDGFIQSGVGTNVQYRFMPDGPGRPGTNWVTTTAGGFRTQQFNSESGGLVQATLLTFCADLQHFVDNQIMGAEVGPVGASFSTPTDTPIDGNTQPTYVVDRNIGRAGWIANEIVRGGTLTQYFSGVDFSGLSDSQIEAAKAAAVQLAIWEVIYETTNPVFGFGDGVFRMQNTNNNPVGTAAFAIANNILARINAGVTFQTTGFINYPPIGNQSTGSLTAQDQIFAVPEFSTGLIAAVGLIAVGLARRRHRRRSSP